MGFGLGGGATSSRCAYIFGMLPFGQGQDGQTDSGDGFGSQSNFSSPLADAGQLIGQPN